MHDEVPTPCISVAADVLSGVSDEYRTLFDLRLQRWWPDLVAGLRDIYSAEQVQALAPRLVRLAAEAFRDRDPELHRLDMRRQLQPDWLQLPRMAGYSCYTERFAGDLAGVAEQIPYLEDLGVTYLHLMPLLTPREGDSDGGYAVADYRSVRPDLGTIDDLRRLTRKLRLHGISLVLDFVVNHVAAEHEWARRARAGEAKYRDYFYIYPDRTMPGGPDEYEQTLPEVFPDFAPGSFTHDPELDGWVWTTFNEFQWDVNWSNPDVLAEYAELVFFLANAGVEVLRLDAIAFIWKRLGTTCQGQPEVHSITQVLRALARIACPALAFKAEAIVAPDELVQYLGRGRFTGKVSDLAYHNSLMVQIWSMLATKNVGLTAHALRSLPPAPSTSAWITYVRCHDDIGWAVSDADAAAVGLDGYQHRSFLSDWYTGRFPGSPARGLTFQHNPATGDRRISGTTATLTGLASASTPEAEDLAVRALQLAHTIIYGWGGVPVIWSGDELACLDDEGWAQEPGHGDDNRWAHRVRVDDETRARRHAPGSAAARAFAHLAHLARVRRELPHLHAATPTWIGDVDDPGVLVTSRPHPIGPFVGLYNVTPEPRAWPRYRIGQYGLTEPVDALTGEKVVTEDGVVRLAPYQAMWLVSGG